MYVFPLMYLMREFYRGVAWQRSADKEDERRAGGLLCLALFFLFLVCFLFLLSLLIVGGEFSTNIHYEPIVN